MSNLDLLAIHLIREGHWTEAVCLYRDELGLSLPQAEKLVVGLADEYDLRHPSRLLFWLWLALAGFTLMLVLSAVGAYLPAN